MNTPQTAVNPFLVPQNVSVGTRLSSMFLDHVFICFLSIPFFFFAMAGTFSQMFEPHADDVDMSNFNWYVAIIPLALYLCKDSFRGRSLAKLALRLQVVDNATGEPASPLKCFIRNIFIPFWFIEVIVTFASPQRRLGDRVAGTKVVGYVRTPDKPDINYLQILISLALSYALMIGFVSLFRQMSAPGGGSSSYSKSSYNAALSKELSRMYTDRLSDYLRADVKAYDSSARPGRRYISLAVFLKENYIDDDASLRQLDSIIIPLLREKLGPDSYTGRLKYIYQGPGVYKASSRSLQ